MKRGAKSRTKKALRDQANSKARVKLQKQVRDWLKSPKTALDDNQSVPAQHRHSVLWDVG